jgi:hypothetical protein
MSYLATLPALPLLPPATRGAVAVRAGSASSNHSAGSAGSDIAYRRRRSQLSDLQLLPWLRLAARQLLGPELQERIEPYRPCVRCVRRATWCGEGGEGCGPSEPASRALRGVNPLTPSLVIGSKADPYPLAESLQRRTRELLGTLDSLAPLAPRAPTTGMEISIFTRSQLILRDLDLLAELDQRHMVTVGVLIPAAGAALAGRLEGRGGQPPHPPNSRFELVRALAAHGIAAEVVCTPIVPGLNNGASDLGRLFEMAWQAGASDVRPAPHHPALPPNTAESRHLLALFHRLRLERGFPRTIPGRG